MKIFFDTIWATPKFPRNKTDLIKTYFEIVLYKDLLERYWVENEYVLKYLFKKVVLTNTKEFSFPKVFNELKSQNIKIWIQSLYNYIEYFKEIFFLSEINDRYKTEVFLLCMIHKLINKNSLTKIWKCSFIELLRNILVDYINIIENVL